jgi:hypothetical protein
LTFGAGFPEWGFRGITADRYEIKSTPKLQDQAELKKAALRSGLYVDITIPMLSSAFLLSLIFRYQFTQVT